MSVSTPPDRREPDDPPIFSPPGVYPIRVAGGYRVYRGEHRVSSPTALRIS